MSFSPSPEAPMLASPKKAGRPPNEDYMKLMRPDEDWRNMADGAERRKIQNRLAQRAYRRNLREKSKEVEKLKHKLRKFEGTTCYGRSSSCSDVSVSGSCHGAESYRSQSPVTLDRSTERSVATELLESDTSDDLNFMFQDFPTDLDDLESEVALSFDNTDFEASNIGSNSSHRSAASALHLSSSPGDRRRCSSTFVKSPKPEIFPSSIGADFSLDAQDFMLNSTNLLGDMIGMMSGSIDGNFPMSFTTPFQSPLQQLPMEFALQEPDSSLDPFDIHIQRTEPDSRWSPDSNASLLHFAVAGGQIETLKLLLQHQRVALDVQDSGGYTPIQRAIMLGRTDMVATLLQFGCEGSMTPPKVVC